MEDCCTAMKAYNIEQISNNLIDKYISELLTGNDLKLLHLFFLKEPTQNDLDEFLKSYDIETVNGYRALMLSYFMKMHPELNFTNYETPRLKGLFNFYRFQNLKLISYLLKVGKVFQQNDIPMLIFKGFAMKVLRPELSRAMGDIDVMVPENCFMKAINLCKQMGYRLDVYIHSIDIHEPSSDEGVMDIHRFIDLRNNRGRMINKNLFKRAKKIKFNGIELLMPSNEDLLYLSLNNLATNLQEKSSKASTLYVLFDCKYLLSKPDFDFDIVFENIKLTQTEDEIAYAINFINRIVPNLIPDELCKSHILQKALKSSSIKFIFNKNYIPIVRRLAKKNNLDKLYDGKISLLYCIKVKLYYEFCKFLRRGKFYSLKKFILQQRGRIYNRC